MNYILRAIFVLSLVALVLCSLIAWQQWSPFVSAYPDHVNFLRAAGHVGQVATFLFFTSALLEAWIGSLDKRVSALALSAFIFERFGVLDSTEKNILLGLTILSGFLLYLLLRRKVPSPEIPPSAFRSAQPTNLIPDSSRLHNTVDNPPTDTPEPQPPFKWAKAKRMLTFIAFGDLDAKQARKEQAK